MSYIGCVVCWLAVQVLLVTASRKQGLWIVPGGGIEPTEDPRVAALREVHEEAGAKGRLGRCLGVFEVIHCWVGTRRIAKTGLPITRHVAVVVVLRPHRMHAVACCYGKPKSDFCRNGWTDRVGFRHEGYLQPILHRCKEIRGPRKLGNSFCNFPNSELIKFCHGLSIVAACHRRRLIKVHAHCDKLASVKLSWQYLQRSTLDRWRWPVYRTERLPLCTTRCASERVARVYLRQLTIVRQDAGGLTSDCKTAAMWRRRWCNWFTLVPVGH